MKVLLLSTLVALAAADTCTDCTAVVDVIKARLSSEESVNEQVSMLVAGLCPGVEDPAHCEEALPDFWRAIAAVLWPGYWDAPADWMCGPSCAAPEDTDMTCDDCTAGVQAGIDQLISAEVLDFIIGEMTDPICSGMDDERCPEGVDYVLRNGLPILAAAADGSEFPAICNAAVENTCAAKRFAKLF